MIAKVMKELEGIPDYVGKVKQWFDLLLVRLCKFLISRAEVGTSQRPFAYLARVNARSELPHESELQYDLFGYLTAVMPRVQLEVSNVAGGRTDIYLPFQGFRFIIEVKRDTSIKWSESNFTAHLKQAAAYSAADVRLGVLATLDLSVREPGVPHVMECLGVSRQKNSPSDERAIVYMRIPGNRTSPSSLSR